MPASNSDTIDVGVKFNLTAQRLEEIANHIKNSRMPEVQAAFYVDVADPNRVPVEVSVTTSANTGDPPMWVNDRTFTVEPLPMSPFDIGARYPEPHERDMGDMLRSLLSPDAQRIRELEERIRVLEEMVFMLKEFHDRHLALTAEIARGARVDGVKPRNIIIPEESHDTPEA